MRRAPLRGQRPVPTRSVEPRDSPATVRILTRDPWQRCNEFVTAKCWKMRLALEAAHDDGSVLAAKSEARRHADADRNLTRGVGDVVQVTIRIAIGLIYGGR